MPDVTCMGIVVADIIVRPVDAWPQRGRLALEESIVLRSGGLAHTTGIVLAKLGVDTAVVARVGSDLFGDFLVQILADHGVRPHVVREPRVPTSTSVVAVSSGGERSFMHMIGANGRLIPEDISDDLLRATRIFHLGGCFVLPALDGEPAAGLLRRAQEQGCRTSMDLAWDPSGRWMSVLEPCLPHLDFLFGNQDELGHVTGRRDPAEMAGMLRERGVAAVAVKLGDAGAFVDAAGWHGRVPAYAVEVVDTTGAGDAFCGGFLAAVLAGWEMERATRFANAVGALCVTAVGGTAGVRSREETLRFMESGAIRSRA